MRTMTKAIYFDMDGTIANLYGVEGWLDDILTRNVRPYREANTMVRMNALAKILNNLQRDGYTLGIVSWLAKNSTEEYDERVRQAKQDWLNAHLPSVQFDEIHIVPYGTPKETVVNFPLGYLFDDEEPNRRKWKGDAFDVDDILGILKEIAK